MSNILRLPEHPDKLSQLALLLEQSARLAREIVQESDQQWFWTEEWQVWEQTAQADIDAGQLKEFTSVEDFLADIRV